MEMKDLAKEMAKVKENIDSWNLNRQQLINEALKHYGITDEATLLNTRGTFGKTKGKVVPSLFARYLKEKGIPDPSIDFPKTSVNIGNTELAFDIEADKWELNIDELNIMQNNKDAQRWYQKIKNKDNGILGKLYKGRAFKNLNAGNKKNVAKAYVEQRVLPNLPFDTPVIIKGGSISSQSLGTGEKIVKASGDAKTKRYRDWWIKNPTPGFTEESGKIIFTNIDDVNRKVDSELFRYAEKWLIDNPGTTLKDFREATGYTGPPLKPKQGRGQPLRLSYKNPDKARAYQAERQRKLNEIKLNNPEADAEYILNQEIASEYTDLTDDDLVARQVTKGKRHVADHTKYPKGGPDDQGRSEVIDPTFNANKQAIEKRVTAFNKKGLGLISLDTNEVGEVIVGPEATYNAYDPGKSRGWKVIPEGLDTAGIDAQLNSITKSNNKFIRRAIGATVTSVAGAIASPLKSLAAIPETPWTAATWLFDAASLGTTQLDKWGTQQLPDDHVYESGATKQEALNWLNRQIGADLVGLEPTGIGNVPAVVNQQLDPRETEEQKRARGEQAIQNVRTMQQHGMTPWF